MLSFIFLIGEGMAEHSLETAEAKLKRSKQKYEGTS